MVEQWHQAALSALPEQLRIVVFTADSKLSFRTVIETHLTQDIPLEDLVVIISDSQLAQHHTRFMADPELSDTIFAHPPLGVYRDEIHNDRTPSTQGYKALEALTQKALVCLGMTGTLVPNSLKSAVYIPAVLRVPGFDKHSTEPLLQSCSEGVNKVREALKDHVLCRGWNSLDPSGNRLVNLPPADFQVVHILPTQEEKAFQDSVTHEVCRASAAP